MKVLRLTLLLMATALCGVGLFVSLRPSPDYRASSMRIEYERLLAPTDTPSRTTTVKRGPDGRLLYFYEGEWRETPPAPQDLPLLNRRPVDQSSTRGSIQFRVR